MQTGARTKAFPMGGTWLLVSPGSSSGYGAVVCILLLCFIQLAAYGRGQLLGFIFLLPRLWDLVGHEERGKHC